MRITLTGRRLALAAALVLGGVAAPLAYATIGNAGKAGSDAASPLAWATAGGKLPSATRFVAPAASPAPSRSAPLPDSPRAATATGDNPYQVSLVLPIAANQNSCFVTGFPAGVNFALTQVSAFATVPLQQLGVSAFVKTGAGPIQTLFSMPVDSFGAGGVRSFDWVVKPNGVASAAVGDIYDVYGCVVNGPTAGTIAFIFTGQKISGPTAASVSDFNARPRAQGALLRWTTASENNLLGFNVWRYRGAKGVKVNRTLVRAKRSGEPAGASYRYIDQVRGAKRGLTYRLQLVDLKGKRTWYAAFAIASK